MLYGADVAVCSKLNTEQINKVWAEYRFLSYKLLVHTTCRILKVNLRTPGICHTGLLTAVGRTE